jgi:copper chaperone
MKRSYRVEGMTCSGCANAVTRALARLDASGVEVDLAKGEVTLEGELDDAAVARAVAAAGFTYAGPLAGR